MAIEEYRRLQLFNQSCYVDDAPTSLSSSADEVLLLGKTYSSEVKRGYCEERKAAIKCVQLYPFSEIGKLASNARKRRREEESEEGEVIINNTVNLDRAMMEIETTERVQGHKNIVQLLGVFRSKDEDAVYFAFERMYGDLGKIIEKRRQYLWVMSSSSPAKTKIPWEDSNENGVIMLRSVFRKILEGLSHIHNTHNRVHGDLKPTNILVGTDNIPVSSPKTNPSFRNAPIKLCDFSNSLPFEESCTEYYTPEYKPPESYVDDVCDVRAADVWAYGITLVETFLCQIAILKGAGIRRDASGKPDRYPSEEYRDKCIKFRNDTIEPWMRDYLLAQPLDAPVSHHFYDLVINKCLAIDPVKRATCLELLAHPYFSSSYSLYTSPSSHSKTPPIDLLFTSIPPPPPPSIGSPPAKKRSPLGIKQTGV